MAGTRESKESGVYDDVAVSESGGFRNGIDGTAGEYARVRKPNFLGEPLF